MLVSVLGLVPEMDKVVELCNKYDVILLEDTCESMGSKYRDRKLGTFGKMASFSTFFGHHISTIEGGFVSTNDKDLYDLLVSIRSHGWDRDLDTNKQIQLQQEWDVSTFNALYTFYYEGFNVRSTDLQAFIGLDQINKLDAWGVRREYNYLTYQELIKNDYWKPVEQLNDFTSNFAYPVIHPNRDKIVEQLQRGDVEVRPMICGSMGTQPFYVKKYGRLELPNVTEIDKYGFYVPNNPHITDDEIVFISGIINNGVSK